MVLFVRALRDFGAARTGAYYRIAPSIGALVSILIFREYPDMQLVFAFGLMLAGTVLFATETHIPYHHHAPVEHDDENLPGINCILMPMNRWIMNTGILLISIPGINDLWSI